jgi:hypothetical protein
MDKLLSNNSNDTLNDKGNIDPQRHPPSVATALAERQSSLLP